MAFVELSKTGAKLLHAILTTQGKKKKKSNHEMHASKLTSFKT